MSSILSAEHITVEFGGLVAVNDVSFDIPEKGIVSLIGPNGAGKTTFFNILTGLYKPTSGHVMYDGGEITALVPHKIAAGGVARGHGHQRGRQQDHGQRFQQPPSYRTEGAFRAMVFVGVRTEPLQALCGFLMTEALRAAFEGLADVFRTLCPEMGQIGGCL